VPKNRQIIVVKYDNSGSHLYRFRFRHNTRRTMQRKVPKNRQIIVCSHSTLGTVMQIAIVASLIFEISNMKQFKVPQ